LLIADHLQLRRGQPQVNGELRAAAGGALRFDYLLNRELRLQRTFTVRLDGPPVIWIDLQGAQIGLAGEVRLARVAIGVPERSPAVGGEGIELGCVPILVDDQCAVPGCHLHDYRAAADACRGARLNGDSALRVRHGAVPVPE
jgi:hypothetical protein